MKDKLKKLVFLLAVLAGLAGLLWSLLAALCSTAISIGMVLPALGGIALIVWGLLRLCRPEPAITNKTLRRLVIICVCIGLAAVIFFEALMLSALLFPVPDEEPAFVLVLGCGIFADGQLTYSLQSRLDTAYDVLEMYPGALCIVSGGQGPNEPVSEAQAMRAYLLGRGVEGRRIIMEPDSRNTAENMKFSSAIMASLGGGKAAVVTNDYHIYRALATAKRFDIDAFGIGAPTNWRIWLAVRIREYVGIVKEALFQNE